MITLFKPDETTFNHNGLGILDKNIYDAVVEEELNGLYQLTFKYPLFAPNGFDIGGQSIIRVPTPDGNQLFRVYRYVKSMGVLEAHCFHIFYDLADNFIEDTNIVSKNGQQALEQIGDRTQYNHYFTFYSDITTVNNCRIVRMNPVAAILDSGEDNTFISRWGGELKRDNFQVRMMRNIGIDRGVTIRYKKDLAGYEADVDETTAITRIMPKGYDGLLLPEKYVDSPLINAYVRPKIQDIEYNDIKVEGDVTQAIAFQMLRQRAAEEFTLNNIDIPTVNYKVTFETLSQTEEYKDYKVLETVLLGDTITVLHSEDGFSVSAKMIQYKYNPLTQKYISVELGNYKEKFSDIRKIYKAIDRKVEVALDEAKDYAQTAANSKNAVYRGPTEPPVEIARENDIWYKPVGNGEVEMYIHNGAGWILTAYSADNLKGTINGANLNIININASNIVTGALNAIDIVGATITGGELRSSDTVNFWDPNFVDRAYISYGRFSLESRTFGAPSVNTTDISGFGMRMRGLNSILNAPPEFRNNNTDTYYTTDGIQTVAQASKISSFYFAVGKIGFGDSILAPTLVMQGNSGLAPFVINFEANGARTNRPFVPIVHEALTLLGGWTNYGNDYNGASFSKTVDQMVTLRGLVKNGSPGSVIGFLPIGCRPYKKSIFTVADGANGVGRVDVEPDGYVRHVSGNTSFISLEGITFLAEN